MVKLFLNVEVFHTDHTPNWKLPVPVGYEMKYEIQNGINPKTRAEFHQLLDGWLNKIQETPDQYGSKIPCLFKVEFRGNKEDWSTTNEDLACMTKKTIRSRLEKLLK